METDVLQASMGPLLDLVDLAVTIVDAGGRVVAWNAGAEQLYGIPARDILGQAITGFFTPSSLMVRRVLETGQRVEWTYHQPRPGICVLVSAAPVVQDGRVVGAMAVERDVTDLAELSNELMHARGQVDALQKRLSPAPPPAPPPADPFQAVRGRHPAIRRAIRLASLVAATDATTLIRGETGVGKELFARAIHQASPRRSGPFVVLNCGAIPATLFESELFGYAPGAFTGANPRGQRGKLELAHGGTLFLDEVGDLPLEAQVKLLRFLEDRKFYRVGGSTPISVDVRVVVATNRDLEELVRQGRYREDLYWRLNVFTLDIPPLRERREDIVELMQRFLHEFSVRYGRPPVEVHPAVIQAMMEHPWPGNVRELRSAVERMVILAPDGAVGPELIPAILGHGRRSAPAAAAPPKRATPQDEREAILAALAAARPWPQRGGAPPGHLQGDALQPHAPARTHRRLAITGRRASPPARDPGRPPARSPSPPPGRRSPARPRRPWRRAPPT